MLKHDEELKVIFFLGTAGSGKSTMASAAKDWFLGSGAHAMVANLDPVWPCRWVLSSQVHPAS